MPVKNINASELKEMVEGDRDLVIVDVRTPEEAARGRIAKSINIPLNSIEEVTNKIHEKNTKIVVYCLSGSRSRVAAQDLADGGYGNIFNLEHGILEWRMNNFDLI